VLLLAVTVAHCRCHCHCLWSSPNLKSKLQGSAVWDAALADWLCLSRRSNALLPTDFLPRYFREGHSAADINLHECFIANWPKPDSPAAASAGATDGGSAQLIAAQLCVPFRCAAAD
jgi:hypothetical protein